ncbi:class I SAM-dependent methyltransferase [Plantibacter flavus]|uniref:class I SAM-dependent methyltransferase n=1 Tax=Plantibacter flavus TaxID=150123 RepID=UPI003F18B1F6
MTQLERRERYTLGHHPSVLRTHSWRTAENSAAYLLPYLRSGLRVLDLGSGPGTITLDFARIVAPGTVIGVDAAAEVVIDARARAVTAGIGNVEYEVGDAYALDLPDDSVDVAHAHQLLQHVGDPVAVIRELRRVVRPGGIIAVRDIVYGGAVWYPLSEGLTRWMEVYQELARTNGGEPDAGTRLKSWAMEAGLTDIRSTASVWSFESPVDREWWGGAWSERAKTSSFATQALETGIATEGDLTEISAAWRDWVEAADGWFAVPHGEIIAIVD